MIILGGSALAQESFRVVRLAKLQIAPAQLDAYRRALKEMETSVREEPGVLSLEAVSVKGKPNEFTVNRTLSRILVAGFTCNLDVP